MNTGTTMITIDRDAGGAFEDANETGLPERRLLLAILERAILDYVGNDPRELETAADWFFVAGDGALVQEPPEPFSFIWVCEGLDLDPQRVAAFVRALPKRGNRRIAPWYFMDRAEVAAATDQLMKVCGGIH
jgi:hypothetical protein